MEGVIVEMCPKLVLLESHDGHHCTGQKIQVCVFLLEGKGNSEALVGILCFMVVRAYPR